jgi:UDP-glucose:(heptosyl)LPS alpha-1,3-glucosyltransferase
LPARGGCETYIADLARRLVRDGHEVHLYACQWESPALPEAIHLHPIKLPPAPRSLRPWCFAAACARALADDPRAVSIGFDKTWGQDILYPQGGLHAASAEHNIAKFGSPLVRTLARLAKAYDLAHWSYLLLERRQYLREPKPLIIVNSFMVREHFRAYYGVGSEHVRVVRSAIDPGRFAQPDRFRRRVECRQEWRIDPEDSVGLFVAMNYRLKGLEPLLRAVSLLPRRERFHLLVAGHPDFHGYQKLACQLGIADCVHFLGPRRDVHACYFAADFLVHPTFYDPCSLVVLEALACGLPVITSRCNGAKELLHPPRDGFVVADPHNHRELAAALEKLIDPVTRSACAQEARRTASQWDFSQHYRELVRVFAEAAARKEAA